MSCAHHTGSVLAEELIKMLTAPVPAGTAVVDPPTPKAPRLGLCWRCEYRAQYLETGNGPRCECGDVRSAKYCCYMYLPTKPCVVKQNDLEDPRPPFAGVLGCRVATARVAIEGQDIRAAGWGRDGEYMVSWKPIQRKEKKNASRSRKKNRK